MSASKMPSPTSGARRIAVALAIYRGSDLALKKGIRLFISNELALVEFLRIALTTFLLLWGSTEISIKYGFFHRETSTRKS